MMACKRRGGDPKNRDPQHDVRLSRFQRKKAITRHTTVKKSTRGDTNRNLKWGERPGLWDIRACGRRRNGSIHKGVPEEYSLVVYVRSNMSNGKTEEKKSKT